MLNFCRSMIDWTDDFSADIFDYIFSRPTAPFRAVVCLLLAPYLVCITALMMFFIFLGSIAAIAQGVWSGHVS